MTISLIKKDLLEHLGEIVNIKHNLGRNKYEEYEAIIKELYDYVFLVECNDGENSYIRQTGFISNTLVSDTKPQPQAQAPQASSGNGGQAAPQAAPSCGEYALTGITPEQRRNIPVTVLQSHEVTGTLTIEGLK